MRIRDIVENHDAAPGKQFDLAIQCLIVLSLVAFAVETLPNLSPMWKSALRWFEIFVVVVFTLEYLARVFVAENKPKFIFSFFGIVDLLAILPFYIAAGVDLRSIRILRILRLARTLKLVRFSSATQRFARAIVIAREELILYLCFTLILLYLAAVGIYYCEHVAQPDKFASVFHSLWWAVTTLTTVGYGDTYPITVGGRIFTFFILMIGLGLVAVPASVFTAALSQAREEER